MDNKRMRKNQKGFSFVEIVLVLLILCVVVLVGLLICHNKHKDSQSTQQSSYQINGSETCGTTSSKDITVTCPANNSSVGSSFTIRGFVKNTDGTEIVKMNPVVIDNLGYDGNGGNWSYINSPNTDYSVGTSGQFSLPINLSGTKVLENKTYTTGGEYQAQYTGVSPGKHTFTVGATSSCSEQEGCQLIVDIPGPTLTLYIK
jgi:prepilin-type N-terminal cleavage/methylation domain-containing protein